MKEFFLTKKIYFGWVQVARASFGDSHTIACTITTPFFCLFVSPLTNSLIFSIGRLSLTSRTVIVELCTELISPNLVTYLPETNQVHSFLSFFHPSMHTIPLFVSFPYFCCTNFFQLLAKINNHNKKLDNIECSENCSTFSSLPHFVNTYFTLSLAIFCTHSLFYMLLYVEPKLLHDLCKQYPKYV